jgi:serine/threonine protein kinase
MPELKLQQSRLDGRYDILECLGRGSYAEIYVANDNAAAQGAPETVVIKALNMHLQDEPDADLERTLISNFQNEAVALDRVRHSHVINRLGHGTAIDLVGTTFHYIVLEYLPGGDMAALTRNRPLSIERTLFYLEQVCSGLAHAHKCGVIHRDIKPQNLLLTADKRIVKIADFGVARLDGHEGAITRVGTNIYSAPEHNPLVHTGQLDFARIASSRDHLTPAADIYSLAKTTYTLLAGESPRRFAQHRITELAPTVSDKPWAEPVLRVLAKATQDRPQDRYQTVEAFWDDLSEASLPKTLPLNALPQSAEARRKPSEDLMVEDEAFTEAAPPRAQFAPPAVIEKIQSDLDIQKRPRIVVPITAAERQQLKRRRNIFSRRKASSTESDPARQESFLPPSRSKRAIVAVALILAFSGMLLATHKYVTSHWNPLSTIPQLGETFIVGREGVTTTDVKLRPEASTTRPEIGLAEFGSKVKVLNVNNNWYEVEVIQHGRPKVDPYSSDRGWLNKRYVEFD